jgi:hypothetical protein
MGRQQSANLNEAFVIDFDHYSFSRAKHNPDGSLGIVVETVFEHTFRLS